MIYNLVKFDDPILRTRSENFDFNNPPVDPNVLSRDLLETMYALDGIGLAANQVGLPHRVFVMRAETPFACFNPRIILYDTKTLELEEGCLTFPGLTIKVKRPSSIKVRFATPSGNIVTHEFAGMTARQFCHETAHLNGEFFFDGIGRLKMDVAIKKAKKIGFNYEGKNLMKYAVR